MKRLISILCLTAMVAALFCGCMQKTSEIKNDMETVASEAENRLDEMVDDGTVNDGDGYVGDSERNDNDSDRDRSENDMTVDVTEYMTEDETVDDGIFGSEPKASDSSEFI